MAAADPRHDLALAIPGLDATQVGEIRGLARGSILATDGDQRSTFDLLWYTNQNEFHDRKVAQVVGIGVVKQHMNARTYVCKYSCDIHPCTCLVT